MSADPAVGQSVLSSDDAVTTEEVFQAHAAFAWRILRRFGVPDGDLEDVCQEVFVTIHRRLPDFERRSSLRTWVGGICVRTALAYRRRARHRSEVPSAQVPEEAIAGGQEEELSLREARAVLDRILDELDDEKRAVFVLFEIEELSMVEICEALCCPLQTAYSRLRAARRHVDGWVERLNRPRRGGFR